MRGIFVFDLTHPAADRSIGFFQRLADDINQCRAIMLNCLFQHTLQIIRILYAPGFHTICCSNGSMISAAEVDVIVTCIRIRLMAALVPTEVGVGRTGGMRVGGEGCG